MSTAGILAGVTLLLALYCGIDPFKHSAISGFPDFEAYKVDLPQWSEVPTERDGLNLLQGSEIRFLNEVQGPESIAFDPLGRGPYTGVADGRVLFWNGQAWTEFAHTSPNRSEVCNPKASPLNYLENEHICGRPLGLRFDKKTGDLYIADAYFGLMKVGPEGGLATSLTTEAEGIPLRFTNDLDIDDEGNVYFTDSSSIYQRRNFLQLVFSGESSGRLLKYNPVTKETTVLERKLQFPNGVSLSKDRSFFVFCEGSIGRSGLVSLPVDTTEEVCMIQAGRGQNVPDKLGLCQYLYTGQETLDAISIEQFGLCIIISLRLRKYWLKGEKAGTSEVLAILPGCPDNVRTNKDGEFWVAVHSRRNLYSYFCAKYPKFRIFMLKLPISAKIQYLINVGGRPHAVVVKYSPEGKLLQILEDSQGKVVRAVSEVEENDGKLWMGSVLMPFIAVYNLA